MILTNRTFNTRLWPQVLKWKVFDLHDYGAIGDDSADDTQAFSQAFTEMQAAGGGLLQVPGGTFVVSSTLTTPADNIWIQGSGIQNTVIKAAAGLSGTTNLLVLNKNFNGVSDLLIDGNLAGQDCLVVQSNDRAWVRDVYIQNAGRHGMTLSSANSGNYRDIKIKSCVGDGLLISSGTDNDWVSLWVGQCALGVRIQGVTNAFTNAHIWGNIGNGVEVRASSVRFVNSFIETNGTDGIDFFSQRGCIVDGCNIWKNGGHGLDVQTMTNTSITGCDVHANGSNGINCNGSVGLAIQGNQCYDEQGTKTQDNGISLSGTCDLCIVTGNVSRTADHTTSGITSSATNSTTTPNIT